ncbi:hypothetical protein EYF80_046472 [Liparis tanakae]|uniref:Secreted protein n=1 Tax=Liparis tanakae TaxID=230148 RepID=A0A4Z2FQ31_9TELE|nr:hypothetical protein EYF80_046472 [Liparis tanakae]
MEDGKEDLTAIHCAALFACLAALVHGGQKEVKCHDEEEAGESATRSAPGIRLTAPSKSQSAPPPPIIDRRSPLALPFTRVGDTLLFPWQLTFSSSPRNGSTPVAATCPPALRGKCTGTHPTGYPLFGPAD